MPKINYDDFEEEIEFIENGKHLDEIDDMSSMADVNPALITKKQQLERQLADLEKTKAKLTDALADVDKDIALQKANATKA